MTEQGDVIERLYGLAKAGDWMSVEAVARTLIRLGASTTSQTHERETPADVADKRGHEELSRLFQSAARSANGLWAAPSELDRLPSSCAWSEHVKRRAFRELRVAYGGGLVIIPRGARYFVDSFDRTLVGWHGTYDPPGGMDGESML